MPFALASRSMPAAQERRSRRRRDRGGVEAGVFESTRRQAVGVWHGPPNALDAPKPTSSSIMMSTFAAPAGGRRGRIGADIAAGSLASYDTVPEYRRSGIGNTSRRMSSGVGIVSPGSSFTSFIHSRSRVPASVDGVRLEPSNDSVDNGRAASPPIDAATREMLWLTADEHLSDPQKLLGKICSRRPHSRQEQNLYLSPRRACADTLTQPAQHLDMPTGTGAPIQEARCLDEGNGAAVAPTSVMICCAESTPPPGTWARRSTASWCATSRSAIC
jgi:hypothetical protein